MTRVEKIEAEIRALSSEERAALRTWFQSFEADLWDVEIAADATAGKLKGFAEVALAEHRKGKTKPL